MIKSGKRKPRKLTKYQRSFIDKYGYFMLFMFTGILSLALYMTLMR